MSSSFFHMAGFHAHDISHFQCRLFRRCPRLGPRRCGDSRLNLAERVRLEHARDMIGGVTGLVVTLVALVLGLLIWTAFGVFSTQKAELQGIAANALKFNSRDPGIWARSGACSGPDAGGFGLCA